MQIIQNGIAVNPLSAACHWRREKKERKRSWERKSSFSSSPSRNTDF